jgi:hypothetical protein
VALIRHEPLAQPVPDKLVLLDDGTGDLWWIDHDGDLLFWDSEEEPEEPYEVWVNHSVKLGDTDDNAVIQQAYADAVPDLFFHWDAFIKRGRSS